MKNMPEKIIATNKKAFHDYTILDTLEVGIKLTGPEVKSIKAGSVSLKESFVHVENEELFIKNMHVSHYKFSPKEGCDPTRNRKLLANKKEIMSLLGKLNQQGLSIVPTKIYLKNGLIKLEIGVAKGKKKWDKRESMKKKEVNRELRRGRM